MVGRAVLFFFFFFFFFCLVEVEVFERKKKMSGRKGKRAIERARLSFLLALFRDAAP